LYLNKYRGGSAIHYKQKIFNAAKIDNFVTLIENFILSCKVLKKSYKKFKTDSVIKDVVLGIKEEISTYKYCRKCFKDIKKTTVRGSKILKVLFEIDYLIKIQDDKLEFILLDFDTKDYTHLHETLGSLRALRTIFNLALLEFALFTDTSDEDNNIQFEFLPTLLSDFEQEDE
jgi:hypothetical protein